MKKAFTFIELLVTLLLGLILINFIFTYNFNFLKELDYIKTKEKLAMESYNVMEIITKGFQMNDAEFTGGVVSLNRSYITAYSYLDAPNYSNRVRLQRNNSHLSLEDRNYNETYVYKNINLNSDPYLLPLEDQNGRGEVYDILFFIPVFNREKSAGLYYISLAPRINSEFQNKGLGSQVYSHYGRIVYIK